MTKSNAGPSIGELNLEDYQRLAQFRYLLRQFLTFSEGAAHASGLTAQQHQALLAIKGFGGGVAITTGTLAERLGIRHHSAVGLIDRLVAKGLVMRQPGRQDRREVLVSLTEAAEDGLRGLSVAHRSELERLAPLLRKLLAHFELNT